MVDCMSERVSAPVKELASEKVAVLCCAVLCCAVLCCAVLCCAVLCCAVLCCAVYETLLTASWCSVVVAQPDIHLQAATV